MVTTVADREHGTSRQISGGSAWGPLSLMMLLSIRRLKIRVSPFLIFTRNLALRRGTPKPGVSGGGERDKQKETQQQAVFSQLTCLSSSRQWAQELSGAGVFAEPGNKGTSKGGAPQSIRLSAALL